MPNDASKEAVAALLLMNTSHTDSPSSSQGTALCSAISVPTANDILNGRGNHANSHIGNIKFRKIIGSFKMTYLAAEPPIKKQITRHVLELILSQDPPGRFLKQNQVTKLWEEVKKDEALRKVAQALRENAPRLRKECALEGNIATIQSYDKNGKTTNSEKSKYNHIDSHFPSTGISVQYSNITGASVPTVANSGPTAMQNRKVTPYDLDFNFNLNTFAITRNRKYSMDATLSDNIKLKSREFLENLSIVGASRPTNLTNIYIMVKMCSGVFELVRAPPTVSEHDILIGCSIYKKRSHTKNAKFVSGILAYRDDYCEALNANDSKRMSHIQNIISSSLRTDSNTRFLEKYDETSPWKVLSAKDSNILISSLLQQACSCIFQPSTTDVIISKEGITEECLTDKYPGNYYFKCLLIECRNLCSDAFLHKRLDIAR